MGSYAFYDKGTITKDSWKIENGDKIFDFPEIECKFSGEDYFPQACYNWSECSYLIKNNDDYSLNLIIKNETKVKKWNSDDLSFKFEDLETFTQFRVVTNVKGVKKFYKLVETTEEDLDKEIADLNKEFMSKSENKLEKELQEYNDFQVHSRKLRDKGYEVIEGIYMMTDIFRKDGVYYDISLNVIDKPKPEEIENIFHGSILYDEYLVDKGYAIIVEKQSKYLKKNNLFFSYDFPSIQIEVKE